MLDPRTYFSPLDHVEIDRPIFLLGFQGGGTTLVSRVIRHHPQVVSVTGNSRYWAGADEMHTVLAPILPSELSGTVLRVPRKDHPILTPPRSWSYATNELFPYYRKTSADASPTLKKELQHAIRLALVQHASDVRHPRFTDKSQVYTVRLGLIRELLKEHSPRFVLLAVNPYVACYKAAGGKAADMKRYASDLSLLERLELCAQHWRNSIAAALDDSGPDLHILRLEDFLSDPERHTRQLCAFSELSFSSWMLPRRGDRVPFGSRFADRWYPIRPSRITGYLERLQEELGTQGYEIIDHYCGDLATSLGYAAPSLR